VRATAWQPRLIQLLAVPGLVLAFYLWLFHAGQLNAAACGPTGWDDCGAVSGPGAAYAAVGPIPVAAIGFGGYALIFLLVWLADFVSAIEDYLPELLAGATALALLFTLYLTGLELIVLHAVCRYCLVSAAIVVAMFLVAASYLRAAAGGALDARREELD